MGTVNDEKGDKGAVNWEDENMNIGLPVPACVFGAALHRGRQLVVLRMSAFAAAERERSLTAPRSRSSSSTATTTTPRAWATSRRWMNSALRACSTTLASRCDTRALCPL